MKIVGIGLNKTGTKSLRACMVHWRQKHISYSNDAFELWRTANLDALLAWVNKYDSFEDWPWPLIYKDIDEKFPHTKFILTRRKDSDTWFRSLCKHAERTGPTSFRKHIYGYEMPHNHRDEHISYYERHLESVRQYFRNRPNDLLEVCWEEGDGWEELSIFLGFERPDLPFPHANDSRTQYP